ncbi:DUF4189 domain-containing protein [Streptomyces sp. NPDC000410]|uniref:DUF4189 domain-containing protein n=1 Tax=Streptomyces sp. NPDC000410 TaxID=3154254 RepID=UPI003329AE46
MTPNRTHTVEHAALTLGRQLGQGGQGTVYEVTNKKINESAADGGWDVVYKEYAAAVVPGLDAAALASRVELLGRLGAAEGQWLCEKTAWPAAVVQRQGHTCGFLMRAVPDRFRFDFRSLTGTTVGTKRLANLEYLLNDDSYVAGIGLTISDRDRLLLLADLGATLARLHRVGITVGDLSPKNLLFTTAPEHECFLIDCDAMRLEGTTVLPQAETPDWQVPAGEEKATRASDVYKLALLAIRLLARDQTTTDPAALAALSPELGDLARSGLNPDPARRPTPAMWAELLTAAAVTASTTPAAPPVTPQAPGRPQAPSARRPGGANRPSPGGTGPGATPPSGQSNVKAGVGVAAVIAAVLLAAMLTDGGSSSDDASVSSSRPTVSDTDYLPDDDPAPDYSSEEEPTEDEPTYEDTTEPEATETEDDPEPTYEAPEPDPPAPPPPPPPPPTYYGAIAVGRDGGLGRSWDHRSASAAEQGALNGCARSDCQVLTTFSNGCGAVAYNSATNQYWGGRGATQTEAQNNAIARAGGGRWITWVCTTRY